ncbi:MAG: acyl-CoA dehydrogenase family protein [Pseudomonadota bacterium]|nr:acyl-CoA dehydrogenase family protein [Pseudomonadota bacterium]
MDFALSEEQRLIYKSAKDFGETEIAPFAIAWEKEQEIPRSLFAAAGALGLAAIYVPQDDGGMGLSRLDATLIFEALALACPSVSSFISIHNMCSAMIAVNGTPEQKKDFLPDLVKMDKVCSYCLTEPGSGSDAAALKTRAERTNSGFKLRGTKAFTSGGGSSDLYLVMARTGDDSPSGISTFIIQKDSKGLSFGKKEQKMGWKAQPTAQLQFDDCYVDSKFLLGEEGLGFKYAMEGLDGGRLNIAAAALGGAQKAFEVATEYARDRVAFGKRLNEFQALQFKLADMETSLQSARIFLRQAAWKLDTNASDASIYCAMAKRLVTDNCFEVANDALQLLGGYGYLEAYGIEKIVRDLRVHQILEGTNEIMRLIISRSLIRT